MNKHILFVMRSLDNPELFTQQEKEANKIAAYAAADAAYAWAAYAYAANTANTADVTAANDAADAAYAAAAASTAAYAAAAASTAAYAAAAASTAAYAAAASTAAYAAAAASTAAYAAAGYAAAYAYAANTANTADVTAANDAAAERWVKEFFIKTSEDEQTYINEVERLKEDKTMKDDKYNKTVTKGHGYKMILDVYDVLDAFEVTCPALQHLAKKALNAVNRGHKDTLTDIDDIIASALRAKELEIQRQFKKEGYE